MAFTPDVGVKESDRRDDPSTVVRANLAEEKAGEAALAAVAAKHELRRPKRVARRHDGIVTRIVCNTGVVLLPLYR